MDERTGQTIVKNGLKEDCLWIKTSYKDQYESELLMQLKNKCCECMTKLPIDTKQQEVMIFKMDGDTGETSKRSVFTILHECDIEECVDKNIQLIREEYKDRVEILEIYTTNKGAVQLTEVDETRGRVDQSYEVSTAVTPEVDETRGR
jgi:hypothetical protein